MIEGRRDNKKAAGLTIPAAFVSFTDWRHCLWQDINTVSFTLNDVLFFQGFEKFLDSADA